MHVAFTLEDAGRFHFYFQPRITTCEEGKAAECVYGSTDLEIRHPLFGSENIPMKGRSDVS